MLVRPAALLCLDEPTNHLDLASREVLEAALAGFPGTIVFISHDRYFINRIATVVMEVVHGTLTRYAGSYDDYLDAKARGLAGIPSGVDVSAGPARERAPAPPPRRLEQARGAGPAVGRPPETAASPPPPAPAEPARPTVRLVKKRPSAEVKELRRRVEDVERKIHELERRIAEIGAALGNPRLYLDGDRVRAVSSERKAAEEEMAGLMREWESLSTALSAHE
jgi:ATP-binding cassette subfamily F protein 3